MSVPSAGRQEATTEMAEGDIVNIKVENAQIDDLSSALLLEPDHGRCPVVDLEIGKTHHYFFSYSSEDSEWANDLLTQLELHPYNLRCIAYERDFAPGQALTNCMEQAVRQSMKTIIILTKAYLNSSWCRLEQGLALTMSIQDRGNRVIPILKEPCEIPDTLKVIRYQNANWDREYLIQKLLDALKSNTPEIASQTVPMDTSINGFTHTLLLRKGLDRSRSKRCSYFALNHADKVALQCMGIKVPSKVLQYILADINREPNLRDWKRACWLPCCFFGPVMYSACFIILILFFHNISLLLLCAVIASFIPVLSWIILPIRICRKIKKDTTTLHQKIDEINRNAYKYQCLFHFEDQALIIYKYDTDECKDFLQQSIQTREPDQTLRESEKKTHALIKTHINEYANHLATRKMQITGESRHQVIGTTECLCQFINRREEEKPRLSWSAHVSALLRGRDRYERLNHNVENLEIGIIDV